MAAKSRRKITITYSNDVEGEQELNAADNAASPAMIERRDLSDGANSINVPSFNDAQATACTIVPQANNTFAITLKGGGGDVGIRLHNTDPTTISLDASTDVFVLDLETEGACAVRLFWS